MLPSETKARWQELFKKPDWYLTVIPELNKLKAGSGFDKKELYDFFEENLRSGNITLATNSPDTDAERKPIDTIIIHHTSNPPGMSKDRLSAIELVRLYAPYFYEPKIEADKSMKGKPIYSGHARNGQQVFWPYHWFVRQNGEAERLLQDSEIGWQAGNWDINCRSIAICFDGDYENSRPSDIELNAATTLIKQNYTAVLKTRVFGHREINQKTTCPSNLFTSTADKGGWKEDLLNLLS